MTMEPCHCCACTCMSIIFVHWFCLSRFFCSYYYKAWWTNLKVAPVSICKCSGVWTIMFSEYSMSLQRALLSYWLTKYILVIRIMHNLLITTFSLLLYFQVTTFFSVCYSSFKTYWSFFSEKEQLLSVHYVSEINSSGGWDHNNFLNVKAGIVAVNIQSCTRYLLVVPLSFRPVLDDLNPWLCIQNSWSKTSRLHSVSLSNMEPHLFISNRLQSQLESQSQFCPHK